MSKKELLNHLSEIWEGRWSFLSQLDYVLELIRMMDNDHTDFDSDGEIDKYSMELYGSSLYSFCEDLEEAATVQKDGIDEFLEKGYKADSRLQMLFTNLGLDSDKMWYVFKYLKRYKNMVISSDDNVHTVQDVFLTSIRHLWSDSASLKITSSEGSIKLSDPLIRFVIGEALDNFQSTDRFKEVEGLECANYDSVKLEEITLYCAYLVVELINKVKVKANDCSMNQVYAAAARFLWCTRLYVSDSFEKNGASLKVKLSNYNPPKQASLLTL